MRILWIVNTIFPYPAQKLGVKSTCLGGWLNGMADNIRKNKKIKLAIATVYNGKKILEFDDGEILYYLIPGAPALKYNKNLEKHWIKINNMFNPDLVHIHGTEFAHGLAFINACPNKKVVTSIQGLVHKIAEVYMSNISTKEIIKNITFRDIMKQDNIFQQKKKYKKRGENEIEIIRKSNAIIGRTTWDYVNCKAIKDNILYYHCDEIIRKEFYQAEKWDIDKIENYSIYVSQGAYPIKGIHKVLQAVKQLKTEGYEDIKLYISGLNIIKYNTLKDKMRISGYGNYIRKLIKKLGIEENVTFIGNLSANEVIERLQEANLVILPSIIENESNSVSEASLLGVPVVCSYVGGIVDRIENGKNGLTYPFTEENMLAYNIKKIFEDKSLAKQISKNSIERYSKILDLEKNGQRILEIYEEIIGG